MTDRKPSMRRDEARERLWLEDAVANLGTADTKFVEHALRRLAVGQELYGDRWAGLGFERLLSELEEEAADIGAWGVLALQAVQTDPNVSDVMRDHIWLLVHVAIALGAYSYQALALVRGDLEQRAGGPRAI
jgi:hypothetical protein